MPLLDADILPVQYADARLSDDMPRGYLLRPAPRRSARGRGSDTFLMGLGMLPGSTAPAALADDLCQLGARAYFETPGSVTAALRAAFTAVNEELLLAGTGVVSTAIQANVICAVMHDEALYLGYVGSVLAVVAQPGRISVYPPHEESSTRPLGSSRAFELRYGHVPLADDPKGGISLLIAAQPAPSWNTALDGSDRLSLRAVAERMGQHNVGATSALLARLAPPGSGAQKQADLASVVREQRAASVPPPEVTTAGRRSAAEALSIIRDAQQAPVREAPAEVPPSPRVLQRVEAAKPAAPSAPRGPVIEPPASTRPPIHVAPGLGGSDGHALPHVAPFADEVKPARPNIWEALGAFAGAARTTSRSAWTALRKGAARMMPAGTLQERGMLTLPPQLMLATAIAIPVVVVVLVSVVYFRRGRSEQFTTLMDQARQAAVAATIASDPAQVRQSWGEALALLDDAARFGESAELTSLRQQGVRALDQIDGITPLEFSPMVPGGLGSNTKIRALVAGDRQMFVLDATQGRVLRLVLGQGGYQLDESFDCESGAYPEHTIDTPVDMVWVPDITVGTQAPQSAKAGVLVAVDAQGGILYCPPGGSAVAGKLDPPRTGWLGARAIDYYNGRLYVLDPLSNGFWRYATRGFHFDQPPNDYFDAGVPNLTDTIDFTVANGDVFFLHADGQLTRCAYNPLYEPPGGGPTGANVCGSVLYNDTRAGRTAGPRIADAQLVGVTYNEPPEPSLFFLDGFGRGAYRFSLALNFLERFRVTTTEEGEATALALGIDKTLYLAIGDQIFAARTAVP
jgi:hypothetical protein